MIRDQEDTLRHSLSQASSSDPKRKRGFGRVSSQVWAPGSLESLLGDRGTSPSFVSVLGLSS